MTSKRSASCQVPRSLKHSPASIIISTPSTWRIWTNCITGPSPNRGLCPLPWLCLEQPYEYLWDYFLDFDVILCFIVKSIMIDLDFLPKILPNKTMVILKIWKYKTWVHLVGFVVPLSDTFRRLGYLNRCSKGTLLLLGFVYRSK